MSAQLNPCNKRCPKIGPVFRQILPVEMTCDESGPVPMKPLPFNEGE